LATPATLPHFVLRKAAEERVTVPVPRTETMDPRKGHKRINLGSANTAKPAPLDETNALTKLEVFLTYEKRYSRASVKSIMSVAKTLFKYYDLSKMTPEAAYTIEADLRERKLGVRTIKHKLETFELIAASRGLTLKLKKPKLTKKEQPSLSLAEARALIQAAENTREVAIIQTLLSCGCRLTRGGLYKIVRRTGEISGIDRNVFVHLCRHTMATLMLRFGVSITDVSLQLGHRNLSSTLVYLHGDISSLLESVDKKFKY
jgi:integrase